MDLFTYLLGKNGKNTHRDLFSYLLGKNAGGGGTYTTFSGTSLNISNTLQAKIKNIALEGNASQDGTPTPSNPVDVNVIKGNNNIVVGNKNLFDYHWFGSSKDILWQYYYDTLGGTDFRAIPIYIGVGNSATFSTNAPQTSPNLLYAINDINLASPGNSFFNSTITRTTQANSEGYVYLGFVNTRQYYQEVVNGTYFIQIEIGETATEYVEHQEQNYPLSLGNIELAKIGNYKDYIFKNIVGSPYYNAELDLNGWYKYNACRKLNITSNLSFSNDTSHKRFSLTITRFNISERQKMKSNRYIRGDSTSAGFFGSNADGRTIYFHYPTEETNTIALFKDWLDNNNLYILYVLETPTYDKITDTTLIQQLENINNNAHSYKGTTIIICSSESEDNETIVFSGDIKVTSVGLGNSLNTSLLSNNLQNEEPLSLDNTNEDEIEEPIKNEEVS